MPLPKLMCWPRGPIIADPLMRAYPSAHCVTGWPLVEFGAAAQAPVPPPPDFYLWELLDLDLASTAAIVDFVRSWGSPGSVLVRERPAWESEPPRGDIDPTAAAIWAAADSVYSWRREHTDYEDPSTVNLDEFRLCVRILRDMVRVLVCSAGAVDFHRVRSDWESSENCPPCEEVALDWAAQRLTWGLSAFGPCVRVGASTEDPRLSYGAGVDVDVSGVCCLQLFNDLVSERRFVTCERCGRVFTRQRGRSSEATLSDAAGTTGSGNGIRTARSPRPARYCSTTCASAASSAMHRQRERDRRAVV